MTAKAVGAPLLSGSTSLLTSDRSGVLAVLEEFDLRLAVENHDETLEDMLAAIGDDTRLGSTVDTGTYVAHGSDPVEAITWLGSRVLHVHVKDVAGPRAAGTVALGAGSVPLRDCVQRLREIAYAGAYSVEHEADDHAPREECRAGLWLLRNWLAEK